MFAAAQAAKKALALRRTAVRTFAAAQAAKK